MVKLTKAQRAAIKRVYDRCPMYTGTLEDHRRMTYREFRKTVQPTFGMDGAAVVRWAGMWLCIERDGYTHS